VIQLDHVSVRRDGATLLASVSLSVGAEVVALVGPSGAGKSTLVRVILGLDHPAAGTLRIGGRIVSQDGRHNVLPEERNVAVVFQDLALWPHLSVHDNLAYGLKGRALTKAVRAQRITAALAWMGMIDKARRRPHELSGGERQRVAIARALVLDPVALLLDEPLGNLDVLLKDELLGTFAKLFRERGLPVLYVTHDPHEARQLAQRVVVLENGRVTQSAGWSELEREPATAFVRAFTRAR